MSDQVLEVISLNLGSLATDPGSLDDVQGGLECRSAPVGHGPTRLGLDDNKVARIIIILVLCPRFL